MKNAVPKFMQHWPRWVQWFLALAMLTAIILSVGLYPDVGIWVAILFGGPTVWLIYAISLTKQKTLEDSRKKVMAPTSGASSLAPGDSVLPKSYELISGPIDSIPGDRLAIRIGDRYFSTVANALFYRGLLQDGDIVDVVCRRNPFLPMRLPLMLVVHVQKTKDIYTVGTRLQSSLALGVGGIVVIDLLTTTISLWVIFGLIAYLIFIVTYLTIAMRAKRLLINALDHAGK